MEPLSSSAAPSLSSPRGLIDIWELILGSVIAGISAPMLRSTDIFSMANGKTVLSYAGSNIVGQIITKGAITRLGGVSILGTYTNDIIDAAVTGVVFTGLEHFLREKGSLGKDFLIGFGSTIVGELINEYTFKRSSGKPVLLSIKDEIY